VEALDRDGRVALDRGNVLALTYDYTCDGDAVEAIAFRPAAEGRYPAVLLIPGFSKTARDYIPLGLRFAREAFASLAVSQRGFGRSAGRPDFVGPQTVAALEAGFRRFRAEPYVDRSRMGLFGYSRGAMAASLLAVRLKETEVRAAVFAAGIYDFKKAYDDIKLSGIRGRRSGGNARPAPCFSPGCTRRRVSVIVGPAAISASFGQGWRCLPPACSPCFVLRTRCPTPPK
jgi:pimeloyl-ACP methyl ester carboxylesterase